MCGGMPAANGMTPAPAVTLPKITCGGNVLGKFQFPGAAAPPGTKPFGLARTLIAVAGGIIAP
ncbi:MAG: hypothetical protein LBF57_04475 [Holosporaceae bacterium]|jgi:hypothetical protein|nr:hypothetical protein [Holosporaceae bacterium]